MDFKKTLMDKLGVSNQKNKTSNEDQRSRINSLRNGETSKVIQTHNIDIPIIDIDQCDKYSQF